MARFSPFTFIASSRCRKQVFILNSSSIIVVIFPVERSSFASLKIQGLPIAPRAIIIPSAPVSSNAIFTSSAERTFPFNIKGILTTFIISGIDLNGFDEVALYIALTELFTKFVLYYVHEKVWLKLPLGRIRNFFFGKT